MDCIKNILSVLKETKLNVRDSISEYNKKEKQLYQESVDDSSIIEKAISEVVERTKKPVVNIKLSNGYIANELDSFVLGYPKYVDGEIPTMSDGRQMRFMAQINFSEIHGLPDFPTSGLLQIWVQSDKYKIFRNFKTESPCKVIYIPDPSNNNMSNIEFDESIYQDCADFPFINDGDIAKNYKMLFSDVTEERISTFAWDILYNLISAEYKKHGIPNIPPEDIDKLHDDPRLKEIYGTKIGGWPAFIQDGIKDPDIHDTLLLQIDSTEQFMWGDSGIGNFFINHNDLVNKKFDNVEFYWDCY